MGRCYCAHRHEGKELVLLAEGFFWEQSSLLCKKEKKNKTTTHKKQTLPYHI